VRAASSAVVSPASPLPITTRRWSAILA
jgi:hypothetical protein